MARLLEHISVINSAVRTLLALVVAGGLGATGWYGYSTLHENYLFSEKASRDLADAKQELEKRSVLLQEKDRTIDSLHGEVARQQQEIDRLDTAMRLLKIDHRVARLTVLDQKQTAESGRIETLIEFQELRDDGVPADAAKQFRIAGDLVYVDAWVVKFDDKYVEDAAIDRGTSLVLFRRIFGEHQKPMDGFALDESGLRPAVYGRVPNLSEFEKKIWGDFWSVANDEAKQAELGIRAAHGEAPSFKVQKGKSYRVELRASGGLSITNEGDVPPRSKPAA